MRTRPPVVFISHSSTLCCAEHFSSCYLITAWCRSVGVGTEIEFQLIDEGRWHYDCIFLSFVLRERWIKGKVSGVTCCRQSRFHSWDVWLSWVGMRSVTISQRCIHGLDLSVGWIALGPVVKFFKKYAYNICHWHETNTARIQSGSSRASQIRMRDDMNIQKWLKKAYCLCHVHMLCWF